MSWGNPEILKHIRADEATAAAMSEFEKACLRIEDLARSKDTGANMQGRVMLAAVPLMREVQHALDHRDFATATEKAIGIADALGCLTGSLLASVPPSTEQKFRARIDAMVVGTMKAGGRR